MALADGYRWREERTYERMAWMTALLLQPWCENKITPADLLGKSGASPEAEANEFAHAIGLPTPAAGDAAYEDLMAHQRRIREAANG